MRFNISHLVYGIFFVLRIVSIEAKDKSEDPTKSINSMVESNDQDMPDGDTQKILKNFSTFTFFSRYPDSYNLTKDDLEKYGKVKKAELLVKTDQREEVIDFKDLKNDATLTFEIKNVISVDGKELPFVRASLSMKSRVEIVKNHENSNIYLWSRSCFLPGNIEGKDGQELVAKSLDKLMKIFIENYSAVNSDKPTFYLFSQ